jgi:glucose-1-phosphate cytidylyltransferase
VKTVILAGGFGTRLSEETLVKPKPMVEIGDQPILWHIMSWYARHGFEEFLVALGYRGEIIKDYFLNLHYMHNDLSVRLRRGEVETHDGSGPDWTVHLVDTGLHTQTGGRLRRLARWLDDGTFMMTYGDGVCDLDLSELVRFHRAHGRLATVTAVRPPARFGGLAFSGDMVTEFREKPQISEGWINGGFFVLEPGVMDYLEGDDVPFESGPLERLAADGQLVAYRHQGFWQCMDTLRDVHYLDRLWKEGRAPWRVS